MEDHATQTVETMETYPVTQHVTLDLPEMEDSATQTRAESIANMGTYF
jgi:hypothetical protein